jgi:hypothetical protein
VTRLDLLFDLVTVAETLGDQSQDDGLRLRQGISPKATILILG